MRKLEQFRDNLPDRVGHVNIGLFHLKSMLEIYYIDMNPVYQRGYVWALKQKENFVGSFLRNCGMCPPFFLNYKDEDRIHTEIVDGKQRLSALLEWLDGKIVARSNGLSLNYDELTDIDCRDKINLSVYFLELSQKDVMKYYIELNSGGTKHTDEELDKVRELIKKSK